MTNEDQASKPKADGARKLSSRRSATEFLSNRAGLIILVVLAAIVGLRLMSSWIKWMLIAIVVAAIVYLVKGVRRRSE